MTKAIHELLLHHLHSLGLSAAQPPDAAQWQALLERVDASGGEGEREADRSRDLSGERYRVLFDQSPLPILVFDHDSLQLLEVNDAAVELYGYTRAEMLAMKLSALKEVPDDPELARVAGDALASHAARALPGQAQRAWRGTKKHCKKDGTVFDLELTSHPVSHDGRLATMAIGIEVTGKRKLEEQLRQAQKMEAVGQLAGGVAHDFNNLLATVLSYADLSLMALGPGHPVAEDLGEIVTAAQRGAALTRQLLAFSRQTPIESKVLSLSSAVARLEPMLRRLIGETIVVSTALAKDLGAVRADPGHIDQVLLNLAVNARDAMPLGGKLTVETRNTVLDQLAARQVGLAAGRYVLMSVADTGCGMDPATQKRIFEPFFTTKGIGKGTGLGLSTVFGIVQQSGGCVTVRSEPGHGATFDIFLPAVEATPSPPPTPLPGEARITVLLVEDDEPVRRSVAKLLAGRGYVVLTAAGSREALDVVRGHGANISILVTDVVMPEVDGRTLAATVRERHPHIQVLFMSGYAEHITVKGGALGPMDHFIEKPFTFQQIVEAVKRALESGPVVGS